VWDNRRLWELTLRAEEADERIYLPIIIKGG
jgi:hypothetical protein